MSADEISSTARATLVEARIAAPTGAEGDAAAATLDTGGRRIALGAGDSPSHPLADVLRVRTSERWFDGLSVESLGAVLVRCGRVRAWDDAERESRPLPSAGGRHPVRFEVVALDVDGLEAGHWRFDHTRCDLVEMGPDTSVDRVGKLLQTLGFGGGAPAVIFTVAEFPRTLSRYPAGATLVWRDAGVALCGLHLCAADLGLSSCILGTAGVLHSHADPSRPADIGGLALGNRVRPEGT